MIFGLTEDYQKIVDNAKDELILTRSKSYKNRVIETLQGEALENF